LNGNTFTISPGSNVNINNGTAEGTSGLLSNLGSLAVAGTIHGDLANAASGALVIEIGGSEPGDVNGVDITGTAALAGTLDISLTSFTPSAGEKFTVLSAEGGITDNGLSLTGAEGFTYSIMGNDLVLTFAASVPEPATFGLAAVGMFVFLGRRRRAFPAINVVAAGTRCMLVAALLAVTVPALAVINNPADSSTFGFKYEGDAPAVNGNPASGFGNTGYNGGTTGYTLSSNGNVLDVSIDGGAGSPGLIVYLQSPDFVSNATDAAGWTWEASLKMNTGRFDVRIGDQADSHLLMSVFDDGTISTFDNQVTNLSSTTDAQHLYRIAQTSSSGQYDFWIDDAYVASYQGSATLGTGGPHWWSDGSGSTSGEYELDYMRFDAGGFSPVGSVPDPSRVEWIANQLENWGDGGNWNNSNSSPGAPNDNTKTAVFGGAISVQRLVEVDGNFTVKAVEFNNANAYALGGLGSVTLDANTGNASITVLNSPATGHVFQADVRLASNTDVTTASGTRLDFNNMLNLDGNTLTITSGSSVNINNNLDSGAGGAVSNGGALGGNGRVNGDLTNNGGAVSPGLSPGTMTVDGNYSQDSSATLAIELASLTDIDLLDITGTAVLDGMLEVSLLQTYMPSDNDTFTVLSAAGGITDNGLAVTGAAGFTHSIVGNNLVLAFQTGIDGDFDVDGDVDGRDFLFWQRGDSPGNGSPSDLALWETNFGTGVATLASATTVPEPTRLALILWATASCIAVAGRQR
ncbi:PEP-CTERM sorting domain-containing protein, partial [Pirellulales bacterium]|nr:PEP-CTERM sorting domain-containing protein [Pirellulales bacterium]